ncbi:MAG: transposase [Pseudonocardiales bacterium]|nr:transposase [Pseudonocardiales bacterium]
MLEPTFLPRVRQLLRSVGVLHVDESPGRAAGGLEYVHVAATPFLTAMHTGGRSAADIDAGDVLPGYAGTIVRDGYAGYAHLIDAHHAWCGAHLLRDLHAVHTADPDAQLWAAAMATTLTDANTAAAAARAGGQTTLDPQVLATIRNHYRGALALGISTNSARAGPLAADALTLARRFQTHEDMILRFVVDLAVPFTNNQAERDVRPVKTSNGPPAVPGAPCKDWPTSPSSSPTYPPPPNGAWTTTTLSTNSSPPEPGYHQRPNPAE